LGSGSGGSGGGEDDEPFPGYPIPPGPDPKLPEDGSLRILIWQVFDFGGDGGASYIASELQAMILSHPEFDDVTIVADPILAIWPDQITPTLLDHYYAWQGREERLAILDDDWDYVIVSDFSWSIKGSSELYFAAVSHLADEIRAHGATPILLSRVDSMPDPDPNGQLCVSTWSCTGGGCNDGGEGSVSRQCAYGSDCDDCGPRDLADAPTEDPAVLLWRVAVGTGCVLVHVPPPDGVFASRVVTQIFTTLFGVDASTVVSSPQGEADFPATAAAAYQRFVTAHETTHYFGPARTVVRVAERTPSSVYRFMTAGTSSEAGYQVAMSTLLEREGLASSHTSLGSCNDQKHVDIACGDAAADELLTDVYQSLYARGYDIPASYILDAGRSPEFMAQVYDRHLDGTDDAGALALDSIYFQSYPIVTNALEDDLSWLPMRIAFGDLKLAYPDADLLQDGVHATETVQAGLAAMSYVSRTGRSPNLDGLDPPTRFAVENGERLIRTMATLTRTGLPIDDTPENRVVVATP
jgi:hypothetical protein